jgi:elongation factor P
MSLMDQLHKGMVIRHDGQLFTVLDYQLAQTGKQKPTVHIKLRNIKGGHPTDRTLDQLGKIEEVESEVRQMQYLYAAGKDRVFMDTESFDQVSLDEDVLHGGLDFLVEEQTYRFLTAEGQVVGLQLPDVVVLEVVDTAPVEHAGGMSNVHKEAKLASGLVVHVPLFIKNGDKIRVNTETRQYLGKEH